MKCSSAKALDNIALLGRLKVSARGIDRILPLEASQSSTSCQILRILNNNQLKTVT